jgi:predicted phage terminase large subunit-like protein
MRSRSDSETAAGIAEIIKTPSSLAAHVCPDVVGYKFDFAPHLMLFERKVLPCLMNEEEQSFLMVNCPPRHGKTLFVVMVAAWYLMMFPTKRVMYVSYNDDFSVMQGQIVKTVIERFGPKLFDVHVSKSAPKSDFQLTGSVLSGMLSAGLGSTLTGRGADLIIIDDLIKNNVEAQSKATKAAHVRDYDATVRSRLEPGGTIIAIATRWAEDDLPGVIQARFDSYKDKPEEEQGDPWEFIELPALAEMSEKDLDDISAMYGADMAERMIEKWRDELGRKEGEPLWPKRYNRKALLKIKNSISEMEWAALYMQRPTQRTGGMFPKTAWRYFPADLRINTTEDCVVGDIEVVITNRVWAWDTAFTDGGGDFTCGLLLGKTIDDELALLEFHRVQGASSEVEALIKTCAYRTGQSVPVIIEQELAGSGNYVIQSFEKLLPGFQIIGKRPEGKKEERATPLSSLQQVGRFILPEGAKFLKDWHHEYRVFPRGRHDDMVDPAVYGYQYLIMNDGVTIWSPMGINLNAEQEMFAFLEQAGIHSGRHVG